MNTVARLPYDRPNPRVVRDMASSLQRSEAPDALFVADLMPGVARVGGELRRLGPNAPTVEIDNTDTDQYMEIEGEAAEGAAIPSALDLKSPRSDKGIRTVRDNPTGYGSRTGKDARTRCHLRFAPVQPPDCSSLAFV